MQSRSIRSADLRQHIAPQKKYFPSTALSCRAIGKYILKESDINRYGFPLPLYAAGPGIDSEQKKIGASTKRFVLTPNGQKTSSDNSSEKL